MPPKRKRVTIPDEDDQRTAKRFKAEERSNVTLGSIPDDSLSEIFSHLPAFSLCAASLTSKRFNNLYEALILTNLSKKIGDTKIAIHNLPTFIKRIFDPRGLYLAFEDAVRMVDDKDDNNLAQLLCRLNNQMLLKINEKINNQKLKEHLNEETLKIIDGKVAYIEISPIDTFGLWEDTDSNTNGGRFKVSFMLFGEKKQFVKVSCSVLSYYEHSGGTNTCDIDLNAKLMSSTTLKKKSTDVKRLVEGYTELGVPEFYSDDEDEDEDDENSEDSEELFRQQVKKGDRVKREWWHDCYPKINTKKLDQVKKWLGWDLSTLEFAKVLTQLSMDPYLEGYQTDIDTRDTKASIESIMKIVLSEDEDQWLNQVERTLDVLYAKIKLKNLIRSEWKKKPKAKLDAALALIERSMYTSWSRIQGIYDPDPDFIIHYKELQYEIKLIAEDPSKWILFSLKMNLCREGDPHEAGDDDNLTFDISSSTEKSKGSVIEESFVLRESDIKLIKDELGLKNFTSNEVVELMAMASDVSLQEIRDAEK